MVVRVRRANFAFAPAINVHADLAVALRGQGRLQQRNNFPRVRRQLHRARDAADTVAVVVGIIGIDQRDGVRLGMRTVFQRHAHLAVAMKSVAGEHRVRLHGNVAKLLGGLEAN